MLSVGFSVYEKKGKNSDAINEVTSKGWDVYPSDGQIHQYNMRRIYQSSDLMIKLLSVNYFFFPDFSCTYEGMCVYGRVVATPLEKGRRLEGSLQGDNVVQNLETFWMNNKTIIEFGFHRMLRIMQISEYGPPRPLALEDNIFLDLHYSSHPTQRHSIIANCKM